MAEKQLLTRIQLKTDTFETWKEQNPTPLAGEFCIVKLTVTSDDGVTQVPATLAKVGDGVTPFNDLEWFKGLAADVYPWAKAEKKPVYEADEIEGLADYISGEIQDTDTQYQLVKVDDYNYKLQSKALNGEWADVTDGTIVIPKYDDTALAGRVTSLEGLVGSTSVDAQIAAAITELDLDNTYEAKGAAEALANGAVKANTDAITAIKDGTTIDSFADVESALDGKQAVGDYATKAEAQAMADGKDEAIAAAKKAGDDAQADVDALDLKVGEVTEGKTVVEMIEDAKTAATYDDTALAGRVSDNETAIATLNDGAEVEGSVDYKIAQAVAAIMENPDETMNSINELVTWINGHAEDALELSNKVTTNENDIATLEGLVGTTGVAEQITSAIEAALKIEGVDKYALAADLTAAIARIAANEGEISTLKTSVAGVDAKADGIGDRVTAIENRIGFTGDVLILNCGNSQIGTENEYVTE